MSWIYIKLRKSQFKGSPSIPKACAETDWSSVLVKSPIASSHSKGRTVEHVTKNIRNWEQFSQLGILKISPIGNIIPNWNFFGIPNWAYCIQWEIGDIWVLWRRVKEQVTNPQLVKILQIGDLKYPTGDIISNWVLSYVSSLIYTIWVGDFLG